MGVQVDDLWASLQADSAPKPKKKKVAGAAATGKKDAKAKSSMGGWGMPRKETKPTLDAAAIAALKRKVSGEEQEEERKKKEAEGPQTVTVYDDQDYVGENIKVKKTMVVGSKEHREWQRRQQKTGIDAVLAAIGPKKQMTTLNKSDIDWQHFKNEAKITDELEQHKRNGGFIEKQDFIARTEDRWLKQDQAENRKRLGVVTDDQGNPI